MFHPGVISSGSAEKYSTIVLSWSWKLQRASTMLRSGAQNVPLASFPVANTARLSPDAERASLMANVACPTVGGVQSTP